MSEKREDEKLRELLREAHRSLAPPRGDFETFWRRASRGSRPRRLVWVPAALATGLGLALIWGRPLLQKGPAAPEWNADLSMPTDVLLEERSASLELRSLPLLDDEEEPISKGEL